MNRSRYKKSGNTVDCVREIEGGGESKQDGGIMMEHELYNKLSVELCCDRYRIQSWLSTRLKQEKDAVTPKLVRKKAVEKEKARLCIAGWGMYPAGLRKKELVAAMQEKGTEEEAKEAKMSVKNDALLAMLYAALDVPANAAEGVTTVEEFVAWVEKEANVAGQSAVDAIGEAPAPMDVEVFNRPAADVMDEENVEAEEEGEGGEVVEEKQGERPARRLRTG